MRSARAALALLGAVAVAAEAKPPPKRVAITVINVTVAPAMTDGGRWDGHGTLPPKLTEDVVSLLSKPDAYSQVLAALSAPEMSEAVAPDVFGKEELATGGEYAPELEHKFFPRPEEKARERPDEAGSFTPVLPPYEWHDVPLDRGTKLKLTLSSRASRHRMPEQIGIAEIGYPQLLAAQRAGNIYQVPVADQTHNQLLFVGIQVKPEAAKK